MEIAQIEHYRLAGALEADLIGLLRRSFPSYGFDRTYYKIPPHFHLLATDDTRLVAQTGVEYRVISADGRPLAIFGVVDLCVAPVHRSRGTASALLRHVEALAREVGVDFVVLF